VRAALQAFYPKPFGKYARLATSIACKLGEQAQRGLGTLTAGVGPLSKNVLPPSRLTLTEA
jgi:hypothetical protein